MLGHQLLEELIHAHNRLSLIAHGLWFGRTSSKPLLRTCHDVQAATMQEGVTILDTLSGWPNTAASYGRTHGPARIGHIPTAINALAGGVMDSQGKFLGTHDLQSYIVSHRVSLGQPLIAY